MNGIEDLINHIIRKNVEDKMKGKLIYNCPLSSSAWICHPSCNWWNGMHCAYPKSQIQDQLVSLSEGSEKG